MPAATGRGASSVERNDLSSKRPLRIGLVVSIVLVALSVGPLLAQAPPVPSPRDMPELYLLIRNRRHQEALSAADQLAKTGQHQPALDALQWILDRPFDALVRDDSGEFRSARSEAARRLEAFPAAAKDQYQRITGAVAAGEWNRLRPPHDAAGCLAIIRSYFATESGYLAASALVSRWLDDGNADLAAALALRVIDDSTHRRRITTAFARRAEMACRAAGRIDDAERIREQWLSRAADVGPPAVPSSTSIHSADSLLRSYQSMASAAPLPQPLWQRPFESLQPFPQLADSWRQWSAEKRDRDQPTALAWHPIVIGDQLIHRDVQSIRAIDIRTGKTLWRHATQLGAEQLLSQSDAEGALGKRLQGEYWEMLFANSLVGTLSTDGQRVYAIDDAESILTASRRNFDPRQWDDGAMRRARNSLIALNVWSEDESGRLAWSTATGVGQAEGPLAGHVFLGPPTIVGGMAFCLTENDRELFAVALEAATGNLLWRQPVALADHSLLEDRQRSLRAGVPTVARGLVLCPTNVGLMVAVDAVTGGFAWFHSCLQPSPESRPAAFRASMPTPHKRHSAFVPAVHASGNRAVYLPTQSDHVYCLDLTTGREVWRATPSDAEYLGGVTDERVIVVGRGTCRSLSMTDGSEQWATKFESVPAGTGVLLADGYLLPLDSGRVLALDLQDGRTMGFDFSEERRPVGHLVLSSDALLAVGGEGVTAYAEAGPALRRLERDARDDAAHWSELAEIYLVQGDLSRAVDALQTALPKMEGEQARVRTERTLREVYFRLLSEQPGRSAEWFARLAPLCRSTDQQARRLIALSSWHLQAGRQSEAVAAGLSLASLADDSLHAAPVQPGLSVSIPVWLATLEQRVQPKSSLVSQIKLASNSGSTVSSRVAEFAFRETSLSREAREYLAAQDLAAGRWHGAELRWLRAAQQSDRSGAAKATRELARMYDAAGLTARAAEQLDLLSKRFGNVELEAGQTGVEVVRRWPAQSVSKVAWQHRQAVDWPVQIVQMEFTPRSKEIVGELTGKPDSFGDDNPDLLYGDYQRALKPTQADAPYEWLLKSYGGASTMMVFDKTSSRLMRSLSIPSSAAWPNRDASSLLGASQSFGVPSELRCVSLLQGGADGLAWSTTLPGWSGRTSIPSCGPSTPFGAVFQLRNELIVVDPADGRVLWRRDDLQPGSGIPADSAIGLLADERIVFVLSNDRQSYRIYEMATGQLMRQARLDHDLKLPRSGIGTLVYHFADTAEGRNLRLWDAFTDTLLIDEPVRDKNLAPLPTQFDRDLVWVTPGGRLRVYQTSTRQRVVDCALESEEFEGVTSLRVTFKQGERYFVNLMRSAQVASADHYHESIRDPLVPMAHVRDDIIAVEPGRDRPLWRRAVPSRSYVMWGQTPAPVLVGASIVKARDDNQRRWLRVEAVDPATGARVGYADRLPEMKLYHADYDGAAGVIRLVGERGDIELKFGRDVQRWTPPL